LPSPVHLQPHLARERRSLVKRWNAAITVRTVPRAQRRSLACPPRPVPREGGRRSTRSHRSHLRRVITHVPSTRPNPVRVAQSSPGMIALSDAGDDSATPRPPTGDVVRHVLSVSSDDPSTTVGSHRHAHAMCSLLATRGPWVMMAGDVLCCPVCRTSTREAQTGGTCGAQSGSTSARRREGTRFCRRHPDGMGAARDRVCAKTLRADEALHPAGVMSATVSTLEELGATRIGRQAAAGRARAQLVSLEARGDHGPQRSPSTHAPVQPGGEQSQGTG
jgi:hypothetical protein